MGMNRPAQVPSLRLMCVTFTSAGSVAGSTAKLWFCALISIWPASRSQPTRSSNASQQGKALLCAKPTLGPQ